MKKKEQNKKNIIKGSTSAVNHSNSRLQEIKWYDKFKNYQALFLFLFAFILYANTLTNDYALDDGLVIKTNAVTLKGFNGLGDILLHRQPKGLPGSEYNALYQGNRYRPLSQLMFAIEYQLFGLKPFIGHLVNILLYALLGVFIFFVLRKTINCNDKITWHNSIPFVASAIFIAHPVHTEVVANIKSRDEIMGMLGGFLAVLFSLKYLENKKIINLAFSFIFFLFGLMSKESSITFIAIVPLIIFISRKATINDYVKTIAPLVIAAATYYLLWYILTGNIPEQPEPSKLFRHPFMYASTAERYATIMLTWLKYLLLLIFPHPLTHDYYPKQVPIIGWSDLSAILSVLIFSFFIVFSLIKIWKKNIIAFGILFFFITFSVTSNLFFDLGLFMNERFMFTFLLGFAIVLAYFLNKIKAIKIFNFVFFALLILYSIKTISRNNSWKNDFTLFTTDVNTSVNSGRCNVVAGSLILDKARTETDSAKQKEMFEQSEKYLKRGLDIYFENVIGLNCLAEIQIYQKQYDSAVSSIKSVFKFDSLNYYALTNLLFIASKYNEIGEYSKSIETYNILLKQKPNDIVYLFNISDVYRNINKIDTAISIVKKVIKLKPDYYDAYNHLAEFYGRYKNDFNQSIQYLLKAYNLNPQFKSTLENLGVIYGLKKDYNNSLIYFMKAYAVDSTNVGLCGNIGRTYDFLGDKNKANEFYLKTNRLSSKK